MLSRQSTVASIWLALPSIPRSDHQPETSATVRSSAWNLGNGHQRSVGYDANRRNESRVRSSNSGQSNIKSQDWVATEAKVVRESRVPVIGSARSHVNSLNRLINFNWMIMIMRESIVRLYCVLYLCQVAETCMIRYLMQWCYVCIRENNKVRSS